MFFFRIIDSQKKNDIISLLIAVFRKCLSLKFSISACYFDNDLEKIQEGQHPLTGQRAPPISGGT